MMKAPLVFIGSVVADIRIQDTQQEEMTLGGCAFNAAWMAQLMQVDTLLFSPIGVNTYAEFVREECKKRKIQRYPLESKEENGCCYCHINASGERSFHCTHGAEYHFQEDWFTALDTMEIDTVYICGLEIEEDSGRYIIEYIKRHPELTVYFACGPRITHIEEKRMQELFAVSPILHLNKQELLSYTAQTDIETAAKQLYEQTHNTIYITLGEEGSCYYEGSLHSFGVKKVKQIDTTGAGDAHIGVLMASIALGYSKDDAMKLANHIASYVVSQYGATLDETTYQKIMKNS